MAYTVVYRKRDKLTRRVQTFEEHFYGDHNLRHACDYCKDLRKQRDDYLPVISAYVRDDTNGEKLPLFAFGKTEDL